MSIKWVTFVVIALAFGAFFQMQGVQENGWHYHFQDTLHTKYLEDEIFINVDVLAEFPGGEGEMLKFIRRTQQYPEAALADKAQGKVVCSFVIKEDGTVSEVEVIRGRHPELDKEAIRIIRAMPDWKPGTEKGIPVSIRFTLSFQFKLPENIDI